jgi:hypothetical protein
MPINPQTMPEFMGERLDDIVSLEIPRVNVNIALIDHAVSVLILSPSKGVPSCRETLKGDPVSRAVTKGHSGAGPHAPGLPGP